MLHRFCGKTKVKLHYKHKKMSGSDDIYLENLEEWVLDEKNTITYKYVSLMLKVHVNKAKQMLYSFVQHQRNTKDNDKLFVTYFISGLSEVNNGKKCLKCVVIPEESLEAVKSTFSVITSSHIYSVGKCKVQDDNKLYSADYDGCHETTAITKPDIFRYSSIKCPSAKLRTSAEIEAHLKIKKESSDSMKQVNVQENKENGGITQKQINKPQKKTGIAGMFANQAKKADKSPEKKVAIEKEVNKEPVKDKKTSKDTCSKKGGVANFFSNQSGKTNEQKTEVKKEEEVVPRKSSPSPKKKQPAGKGKGKRSVQESDDDSQKKRRRIKAAIVDSSSEEEMEYESPIPSPVREPSPSPQPESPIPQETQESPKKESPKKESGERKRGRRRKLVPKTFMDDEGYMVTEKVWESESASEAEQPPSKKQTPQITKQSPQKKKTSPKKKSPPSSGSGKQAALTSFFKKK